MRVVVIVSLSSVFTMTLKRKSFGDFEAPRERLSRAAIFVAVSAATRVESKDCAIVVAFRKWSIGVNKGFSPLAIKEYVTAEDM